MGPSNDSLPSNLASISSTSVFSIPKRALKLSYFYNRTTIKIFRTLKRSFKLSYFYNSTSKKNFSDHKLQKWVFAVNTVLRKCWGSYGLSKNDRFNHNLFLVCFDYHSIKFFFTKVFIVSCLLLLEILSYF